MPRRLATLALLFSASAAVAADMLPLKQGIYVPVGRACKGASNADIVNYLGGNHSIGAAGGVCTIRKLKQAGSVFTIDDVCKGLGGDEIEGGPTVVKIASASAFTMSGTRYRYCGARVEF